MSGITGFIDTASGLGGAELERRVTAMADALNRRGPDGGETWVDEAAGVALGFRYLAVGGLSFCRRGNRALLLDGEIYNRAEWRCSEVESDWPAGGGGRRTGRSAAGGCGAGGHRPRAANRTHSASSLPVEDVSAGRLRCERCWSGQPRPCRPRPWPT